MKAMEGARRADVVWQKCMFARNNLDDKQGTIMEIDWGKV